MRPVRNYIIFRSCGRGRRGEAFVDAIADGLLEGDLRAESVDRPLGEGAEVVFLDNLRGLDVSILRLCKLNV